MNDSWYDPQVCMNLLGLAISTSMGYRWSIGARSVVVNETRLRWFDLTGVVNRVMSAGRGDVYDKITGSHVTVTD